MSVSMFSMLVPQSECSVCVCVRVCVSTCVCVCVCAYLCALCTNDGAQLLSAWV